VEKENYGEFVICSTAKSFGLVMQKKKKKRKKEAPTRTQYIMMGYSLVNL
jgi:hypothetical protein